MPMRKKIYAAAGYNTLFYGPGRKEFNPKQMPGFESYLQDTAQGTCDQVQELLVDEGVIGSFMSSRFLSQGNLSGFLPFMVPSLAGKPCLAVEGACATGSKAVTTAIKAVLSEMADTVFVTGFEMQNTMKPVLGADVLAGAAYYSKERKEGLAYFFPGLFAQRAKAYYDKYDPVIARQGMAKWYELAVKNARHNPKAQEFDNQKEDLLAYAMLPPNAEGFIPYLNHADCSKVSDGASSILILSEEGLKKNGISKTQAIEITGFSEAQADITLQPEDPAALPTTRLAVLRALEQAGIAIEQLGCLELHDCFSITALMALEAAGFAERGKGAQFILEGHTAKDGRIPTNLSGGLVGFGHPTGATGVRQLVDLWMQLTGIAPHQAALEKEFGLMINMGGNDKTLTALVAKKTN